MILPATIRATRSRLKESRSAFGARLRVSAKAVEAWEQGSRSPSGSAQLLLEPLIAQVAAMPLPLPSPAVEKRPRGRPRKRP